MKAIEDIITQLGSLGIAGGSVILLLLLLTIMKSLRHTCGPNEVLIFSGRRRKLADGSIRGFRVEQGGGWRNPIFEKVDRMNLNLMEVPIAIRGAFSKGGIPLNVDAIANVKISSDTIIVNNAIERFLGRDPNEIRRVAKETLEGHLRGVLARLTPEEVNEDRLKFAEELSTESEHDLKKLGIHLDTFKIQHVSDDRHYLDSIGREMIANIIRDAQMSESDAERVAELAEASNQARGKVRVSEVESSIAAMKNDLRRVKAEVEQEIASEEERTKAAAREARAVAEQELQRVRAQVEALRLQCDQVLPAEAAQRAQEFRARGDAAILRERGLASSQALEEMSRAWQEAGQEALTIFLIEDIEKLLTAAAEGVKKVKIDEIQLIDSGDGSTLSGYISAYPKMLSEVLGAVTSATGINISQVIGTQAALPAKVDGEVKA
ncbi:MAG: flotillin family protein [Fimbriimonas sp.]